MFDFNFFKKFLTRESVVNNQKTTEEVLKSSLSETDTQKEKAENSQENFKKLKIKELKKIQLSYKNKAKYR